MSRPESRKLRTAQASPRDEGQSAQRGAKSIANYMGGDWAGQKGMDDAALPQRMEIDYVRVWQVPTGERS